MSAEPFKVSHLDEGLFSSKYIRNHPCQGCFTEVQISMLCSYRSGNPSYLTFSTAFSSRCICWLFIFFLLVGTLHGISASRIGASVPTHSNFFRSVIHGRERVFGCANDPTFCSNREKNPWGGNTCCSQKFCKDITRDANHCGACGRVCGYRLVCCNGKCVDVRSDPQHCGACFEECPGKNRCSFAMCDYGG